MTGDPPATPLHPASLDDLEGLVGVELGPTGWCVVDQKRIDDFARTTGDSQWIHVDVDKAGVELGSTIAHGMLTLSLGPKFLGELISFAGFKRTINYGFEKVRFAETVPAGSQLRMRLMIAAVAAIPGGARATITQTTERAGSPKPVCFAQSLVHFYL